MSHTPKPLRFYIYNVWFIMFVYIPLNQKIWNEPEIDLSIMLSQKYIFKRPKAHFYLLNTYKAPSTESFYLQ